MCFSKLPLKAETAAAAAHVLILGPQIVSDGQATQEPKASPFHLTFAGCSVLIRPDRTRSCTSASSPADRSDAVSSGRLELPLDGELRLVTLDGQYPHAATRKVGRFDQGYGNDLEWHFCLVATWAIF